MYFLTFSWKTALGGSKSRGKVRNLHFSGGRNRTRILHWFTKVCGGDFDSAESNSCNCLIYNGLIFRGNVLISKQLQNDPCNCLVYSEFIFPRKSLIISVKLLNLHNVLIISEFIFPCNSLIIKGVFLTPSNCLIYSDFIFPCNSLIIKGVFSALFKSGLIAWFTATSFSRV